MWHLQCCIIRCTDIFSLVTSPHVEHSPDIILVQKRVHILRDSSSCLGQTFAYLQWPSALLLLFVLICLELVSFSFSFSFSDVPFVEVPAFPQCFLFGKRVANMAPPPLSIYFLFRYKSSLTNSPSLYSRALERTYEYLYSVPYTSNMRQPAQLLWAGPNDVHDSRCR